MAVATDFHRYFLIRGYRICRNRKKQKFKRNALMLKSFGFLPFEIRVFFYRRFRGSTYTCTPHAPKNDAFRLNPLSHERADAALLTRVILLYYKCSTKGAACQAKVWHVGEKQKMQCKKRKMQCFALSPMI
jgi:hypothetical protein